MLHRTLYAIKRETDKHAHFEVHYALKANAHPQLLQQISQAGFGAACVRGGEITAALKAGFPANKIVFAGVGKRDDEIRLALQQHIFCFHVESLEAFSYTHLDVYKRQVVKQIIWSKDNIIWKNDKANAGLIFRLFIFSHNSLVYSQK